MKRYWTQLQPWAGVVAIMLGSFGPIVHAEEVVCRYCAQLHGDLDLPGGSLTNERFKYAPVRQVDVLHIKLDVTPDLVAKTVAGTVSITAKAISKPVDVLRLDAVDIKIRGVRSTVGVVDDFVSTRDGLQIAFEEPLPVGQEFRLDIDFSAQPDGGLYFRTADMGYPEGNTHIWTQGEPSGARLWFPCFDYPNERSSTEIICHVPQEMTVLSNGQRMGESIDANGLKAVRWLQELPHVNYLICLVAGHFEKLEKRHRDIPLGFYTQPTLIDHAGNSFADTPDIMAFFEKEIGMPFPWVKYDQVTIADFVAGGMENTTMTTLTDQTIFSAATENIRSTRSLDAHEMAHQWFGDYVTCKDWSHLWLNEGFATYYASLYEGHKFGRDALLYRMYMDATKSVLPRDKDTRPIVYNEYDSPRDQFDFRAYPKGSWVLHMLRSQLGEDLYRKCILAYLKKHSLSSVVTDDLRQVIEEETGLPMDRFFDQWVYHPRHPDLKIRYQWLPKTKLAKVTIEQTQTISDDVLLYEIPTKLRFIVDGEVIEQDVLINDTEQDFYVSLPAQPSIVRFDPEYSVLAKVSFDLSNDLLAAQVNNDEDMIGRLIACEALGKRKTNESVDLLTKRLREDAFFGVRIAAAEALSQVGSDKAIEALKADWPDQKDARVRLAVVREMLRRFETNNPNLAVSVIENEKNPAIQAIAIESLGKFYGEPANANLVKSLHTESFGDELAIASIRAIAQQNDPAFVETLLQFIDRQGSIPNTRLLTTVIATIGKIGRESRQQSVAFDWIVTQLEHPKTEVKIAAISALGELGDRRSGGILAASIQSKDERVQRAAQQANKALDERVAAPPNEVVQLRKALTDLKEESESVKKQLKSFEARLEAIGIPPGDLSTASPDSTATKD